MKTQEGTGSLLADDLALTWWKRCHDLIAGTLEGLVRVIMLHVLLDAMLQLKFSEDSQ